MNVNIPQVFTLAIPALTARLHERQAVRVALAEQVNGATKLVTSLRTQVEIISAEDYPVADGVARLPPLQLRLTQATADLTTWQADLARLDGDIANDQATLVQYQTLSVVGAVQAPPPVVVGAALALPPVVVGAGQALPPVVVGAAEDNLAGDNDEADQYLAPGIVRPRAAKRARNGHA